MANEVARHFLNDKSFKLLESSEGVKELVSKRKKIGELRLLISRLNNYIGRNDRKIAKKKDKLAELDSVSFFKKLFSLGKISREKAEINGEVTKLQAQNAEYDSEIKTSEYEIVFLQNEIKRFEKKLEKVGLTIEDIIEEYKLILEELKAKEKAEIIAKAQAESPEKPQTKKAERKTAIERFNERQVKHQQILDSKQKI